MPATLEVHGETTVLLTISEGKKRQVRRMFASLGYTVETLHRISVGGLHLETLGVAEGEAVEIEPAFLRQLVFEA